MLISRRIDNSLQPSKFMGPCSFPRRLRLIVVSIAKDIYLL